MSCTNDGTMQNYQQVFDMHQKSPFASRDCDLQVILDELDVKTVITSNISYLGASVVRHERHNTINTCCPLLLNVVTNESVLRNSTNKFQIGFGNTFYCRGGNFIQLDIR